MELAVPGAALYYETRGAGRTLLMICGGPTDAGVFAGVASVLSSAYRVVTYDPRGNSRSVAAGPPGDHVMDVHGDDAAALLAAVTDEPAFVFGNSGGAQIGLNLAARYGARVKVLIAHEPPCMRLLPDPAEWERLTGGVSATYRNAGPGPAMAEFMAIVGLNPPARPPAADSALPGAGAEAAQTLGRIAGNLPLFFEHGMVPISEYVPDVAALRAVRVVVGAGESTAGLAPHRAAVALADALGSAAVVFPGDHGGYTRAREFAATMRGIYSTI